MKRKTLILELLVILIGMLFILTGCGNSEKVEKNTDSNNESKKEQEDYSKYVDLFTAKIISEQLNYYAIEDFNNDGMPELVGKTANLSEPNFRMYKIENDTLKEISEETAKTSFKGILKIQKNEKGIFIISEFGEEYTLNGGIIDFAYIDNGKYIEYSKMIGLSLDTLQNSKVYKKTFDFNTMKITEVEYDFTTNPTASSFDKAVTSIEYDNEISKLKSELNKNLKGVEFYENTFSEYEHDDTNLKNQVKNVLETFSNSKETTIQENV